MAVTMDEESQGGVTMVVTMDEESQGVVKEWL